jgi:hypothetical protein
MSLESILILTLHLLLSLLCCFLGQNPVRIFFCLPHPDKVGGTCGTHGEGRGVYRVLVGRPEGKRPLGRPRRKWEDSIKMDLREIGIEGANWIHLAQDRVQ